MDDLFNIYYKVSVLPIISYHVNIIISLKNKHAYYNIG